MEEKKNQFIEIFFRKLGLVISTCDECGITKDVFQQWVKDDTDFANQVATIEERRREFAESAFFSEMQNGNLKAIEMGLVKYGVKGWAEPAPTPQSSPKERRVLNAKR